MANRIAADFIDLVLARTDIVELINSRVPLRRAGREYQACCPFHQERTPSFTVSPRKQFYHCFGCGAHGSALGFLMDYEHLNFPEAVTELARLAGLELPADTPTLTTSSSDPSLLGVLEQADLFFRQQLRQHPQRQQAVEYLRQRGLSGEIARDFGLGFAPLGRSLLLDSLTKRGISADKLLQAGLVIQRDDGSRYDRFRGRVMFPIRDRRGQTIGFGGRVLSSTDSPKYLNSPETPLFHKGRELYGLFEARQALRQIERLLVVEGYMDVLALVQYGIPYAVATLGTATTSEHAERLFRVTANLVFCFDGDRAGREAVWRALENVLPQLRDGRQVRFLFLPDGQDPDSLIRQEGRAGFEQRLDHALPLSDYLLQQLSAKLDLRKLDDRARLLESAKPLLKQLPDSAFRDLLSQQLAELAQTEAAQLQSRLGLTTPTSSAPAKPVHNLDIKRTPVRTALALLLNSPSLAQSQQLDSQRLRGANIPGVELLLDVLEFLRTHPHIASGGQVVEHFREQPRAHQALEKLLAWSPEIDEALLADELHGTWQHLVQLAQRTHHPLLSALATGGLDLDQLSAEQRLALRQLGRIQ